MSWAASSMPSTGHNAGPVMCSLVVVSPAKRMVSRKCPDQWRRSLHFWGYSTPSCTVLTQTSQPEELTSTCVTSPQRERTLRPSGSAMTARRALGGRWGCGLIGRHRRKPS